MLKNFERLPVLLEVQFLKEFSLTEVIPLASCQPRTIIESMIKIHAECTTAILKKPDYLTKLVYKYSSGEKEEEYVFSNNVPADVEKAKRKVEGDLKFTQKAVVYLERNKKEIDPSNTIQLRGTLGTIYLPISNSRMNSNDLHSLLESLFSFRFRVDLCIHMHPDNLDRFANRLEVIELRGELHDADVGYVGNIEQFCPREIERSQKLRKRASERPVLETLAHGRNREDFHGHFFGYRSVFPQHA
ncbi:Myosin heavy chain, muscle [Atta colombica]|uniref:Myosin heavy chain, muscle n=1 Tax=Atta colombica TaxID=520822 RepID=A0A195BRE3_9HYME|nr:Myosin heavy chain, muscle [Atta colombica]